jgi:hypothetical protein
MNALSPDHPAQLAWGFVLETEAQAALKRQGVFAFLAMCARPAVIEVRELFREIATDADYLDDRLHAAAEDGRLDGEELAELSGLAREIKTEAVTGKIIR